MEPVDAVAPVDCGAPMYPTKPTEVQLTMIANGLCMPDQAMAKRIAYELLQARKTV